MQLKLCKDLEHNTMKTQKVQYTVGSLFPFLSMKPLFLTPQYEYSVPKIEPREALDELYKNMDGTSRSPT